MPCQSPAPAAAKLGVGPFNHIASCSESRQPQSIFIHLSSLISSIIYRITASPHPSSIASSHPAADAAQRSLPITRPVIDTRMPP
jgi:hypothetical protein